MCFAISHFKSPQRRHVEGGVHKIPWQNFVHLEDRRNKGWGKISTIMGILSEVDMGVHQLEAGLRLHEAILISSLLYFAEAWSGVTDRHMSRLEVVVSALLKRLTGSHSKCPSKFHHLETGTWKLRHHLIYL